MAKQSTVLVRPKVDLETVRNIVFDLYGLKVTQITELNGYDDKNFHLVVDDKVMKNNSIDKVLNDGYVLKIVNTLDSENKVVFEAQTELLMFLNKSNIRCQRPISTKDNKPFAGITMVSGYHIVRLLEFIPGDILFKLENPHQNLYYQVGVLAAELDNVLKNFTHPAYCRKVEWCLGSAPDILDRIHAVDQMRHLLVKETISEFSSRVLAVEDTFDKGIIHGDLNEQNLLVGTVNNEPTITAVLDFGDTHYCCYLYELAIAMAYMIFMSDDIDSGGYVLAGYSSGRNVKDEELGLLRICVKARLCQSLVMGAHASLQDPSNEYVLTTAKRGWSILEKLSSESEESVLNRWRQICRQKL